MENRPFYLDDLDQQFHPLNPDKVKVAISRPKSNKAAGAMKMVNVLCSIKIGKELTKTFDAKKGIKARRS